MKPRSASAADIAALELLAVEVALAGATSLRSAKKATLAASDSGAAAKVSAQAPDRR